MPKKSGTWIDWFWEKVDKSGDCWLWTGMIRDGRPRFQVKRKDLPPDRIAWELIDGEIGDRCSFKHSCGNDHCVNPEHMTIVITPNDTAKRFWQKVDKQENGCWLWTGAQTTRGFGKFWFDQSDRLAHQFSWSISGKGDRSRYTHVRQSCGNKLCVNPDHLVLAIDQEEERFWSKVDIKSDFECWLWCGFLDADGYGLFPSSAGRLIKAHRYSWEQHNKSSIISPEVFVCHHCDNPTCVNPQHLFLGAVQDNIADMVAKNRHVKGERCWRSKLKAEDIPVIVSLSQQGVSAKKIGRQFNVSGASIHSILKGKTWKHVKR